MTSPYNHRVRPGQPWFVGVPLGAWLLIYLPLGLARHIALQTNAYDLSVFDYALWGALHGAPGHVPFFGHSLGSHHVMPTLYGLMPLYALVQSPVFLIVAQIAAVSVAAVLVHLIASRQLAPWLACAVTTAFLFSQRTHVAMMSPFYIESLEPALVFGLVLAARSARWRTFWILALVALGCKEDAALYLLPFAVLLFAKQRERRAGLILGLIAAVWLSAAVLAVMPWSRSADGLPAGNPFLQDRLMAPGEGDRLATIIAGRLASTKTVSTIVTITSQVGFLCWAGPPWLAVVAPGALVNLAARSDTLQAGLHGHYIWPVLPWIFMATIAGSATLVRRLPKVEPYLVAGLFAITVVNSPLPRSLATTKVRADWQAASTIRGGLDAIPPDASVTAMPNLIPHLGHRKVVQAIGRELPGVQTEYVALSINGDLWPLDRAGVVARIDTYLRRADYEMLEGGPLYLFRRIPAARLDARAGPESPSGER